MTSTPLRIRAFALIALLSAPLIAKITYISRSLNSLLGEPLLGIGQILTNDAPIYTALLVLVYLSLVKLPIPPYTHRALVILLRLTASAIFALYVIDLAIIINFNTHLTLNDALKYTSYAVKYAQQGFSIDQTSSLLGLLVILLAAAWLLLTRHQIARRTSHVNFLAAIAITLSAALLGTSSNQYVHTWIFSNIIDYNLTILSENKPYSAELSHQVKAQPGPPQQCQTSSAQKPNIIVLMIESLSSHHSQLFSGVKNWTPKLDQLASNHLAFTNFYANGFTTEDAEISLLTGRLPLYPPASYSDGGGTSFNGFYHSAQSLPKHLKQRGYQTDFLTSADLGFSNTGAWAKSLGFDHIEGHEHPSYLNWPRYHFNSVPDEALFNRLLSRIQKIKNNEEDRETPHFVFLKTVSTHHPYINPDNNNRSEQEAIEYADRQIDQLYQKLDKTDFFTNGLLIVVGDHRSMTPLKPGETEALGELRASARVPLIVVRKTVENGRRQLIDTAYQQVDLFNSLNGLTSGQRCTSEWTGDIFSLQPPKYVYHRRGDNRNTVNVFTDKEDYSIILDGDNTRITNNHGNNDSQKIIEQINRIRMSF